MHFLAFYYVLYHGHSIKSEARNHIKYVKGKWKERQSESLKYNTKYHMDELNQIQRLNQYQEHIYSK